MADITPVTREEFYLAKAGGQDVPVPSAVTREEYYLEKLSNDSVVVPSPVTRREKFLYFACGGKIDLPSEDRMTRLERLIAKAGGMDVSTPTAVTRLEKFWANVEGGGWKIAELTGTLPMTFRSNGTALINYRIYGTAEGAGVQTENMLKITATTQETHGVTLTVDNGEVILTGTATSVIADYIITGELTSINEDMIISGNPIDAQFSKYHINIVWKGGANSNYITSQPMRLGDFPEYTSKGISSLRIIVRSGAQCNNVIFKPMIRKANTPPDFEPFGYKIPLTVTNGTETKTTDICIGDSKLGEAEYVDYGEQKIYKRILFMTHNDKQFITKDNKDFCLRRRGYNG